MGEIKRFNLPDVGEGLTEAEILSWSVKVGDVVTTNQILVEIETAKAAVELPSPFAGKVVELLVEQGQTVDVGTPIIGIDVDPSTPTVPAPGQGDDMTAGVAATAEAKAATQDSGQDSGQAAGKAAEPKREPVLVGYGVKQGPVSRRARKSATTAAAPAAPVASDVMGASIVEEPLTDDQPAPAYFGHSAAHEAVAHSPGVTRPAAAPAPAGDGIPVGTGHKALAKPPVRKLAKDLGRGPRGRGRDRPRRRRSPGTTCSRRRPGRLRPPRRRSRPPPRLRPRPPHPSSTASAASRSRASARSPRRRWCSRRSPRRTSPSS